jgi:hypothetical protein
MVTSTTMVEVAVTVSTLSSVLLDSSAEEEDSSAAEGEADSVGPADDADSVREIDSTIEDSVAEAEMDPDVEVAVGSASRDDAEEAGPSPKAPDSRGTSEDAEAVSTLWEATSLAAVEVGSAVSETVSDGAADEADEWTPSPNAPDS